MRIKGTPLLNYLADNTELAEKSNDSILCQRANRRKWYPRSSLKAIHELL